MRQADINRVNRAKDHLKAATIILSNIKWENLTGIEDMIIIQSKDSIKVADMHLDDIINIQK